MDSDSRFPPSMPSSSPFSPLSARGADTPFGNTSFPPGQGKQPGGIAWGGWFAWVAILCMVAGITLLQNMRSDRKQPVAEKGAGKNAPEQKDSSQDQVALLMYKVQAKYMVGLAAIAPDAETRKNVTKDFRLPSGGSVLHRLCGIAVAGELQGGEKAAEHLRDLQTKMQTAEYSPKEREKVLIDTLNRLYADYRNEKFDAPSVTEAERKQVVQAMNWFGELALSPEKGPDTATRKRVIDSSKTNFAVTIAVFFGGLILGMGGFVGLVIFGISALLKGSTGKMSATELPAGIFAETFACWMFLYMFLSLAISWLWRDSPMAANMTSFLGSLSALAWPVLRGYSWSDIRRAIGWTTGKNLFVEGLAGMAAFAMSLPITMCGLIVTVILFSLFSNNIELGREFSPIVPPSHPIVELVASGGWGERLLIFIVAAVVAPLVEETMFRGVFYRHFVQGTRRWGFIGSFLFGTFFNSLIFALIHPQGLLGVPALMSVACGLTLARQWRDSLIAPIVLHGIHNGCLTLALFLVVSG